MRHDMGQRSMVVLVYDVADDRRRGRLRSCLMRFGTPVQESVFEFSLTREGLDRMLKAVHAAVVDGEDAIRYYVLCRACRNRAAGMNGGTCEPQQTVVV
jgi:CRISPR-associated protein Cas2